MFTTSFRTASLLHAGMQSARAQEREGVVRPPATTAFMERMAALQARDLTIYTVQRGGAVARRVTSDKLHRRLMRQVVFRVLPNLQFHVGLEGHTRGVFQTGCDSNLEGVEYLVSFFETEFELEDTIVLAAPGGEPSGAGKRSLVAVLDYGHTRRGEVRAVSKLINAYAMEYPIRFTCDGCWQEVEGHLECPCHRAMYCNVGCQRLDWAHHSVRCPVWVERMGLGRAPTASEAMLELEADPPRKEEEEEARFVDVTEGMDYAQALCPGLKRQT